ncbi:MAG: 50S ribosomal protein L3 [Planctomycetes bacterium]|nr:50S ribosomal protein L3 [Planctomycetota bacterium]
MIKLIGTKKGMTTIFTGAGRIVPVTVLEVKPCPVVQVKTVERDGYAAVQLGFDDGIRKKNIKKPMAGHLKKSGVEKVRMLKELRLSDGGESYELGSSLSVKDLNPSRPVNVAGKTKGRGFAGGMKRHGFSGGPASHGTEKRHRTNGSLSSTARLTHVWKGKRMSGHMGNVQMKIRNLDIVSVNEELNQLVVKGSVPGFSGAIVIIEQL